MIMTTVKFGVTPMESGSRCAGTAELADHQAKLSKTPIMLIKKRADAAFKMPAIHQHTRMDGLPANTA
ncbi:MAG: hypothetical protein ACJAY2_002331 [Pseudomonadales bacterium]|jgi:hypothetical protein